MSDAGEHRDHARGRRRRDGIDPQDPPAGEVAAREGGVQHPCDHDVVDVPTSAGQQPRVLLAVDPAAHRRARTVQRALIVQPPPSPRRRSPGNQCTGTDSRRGRRRISSSVGTGLSARNAVTDTTKPGVQKPHCRPWWSAKACWTGLSDPSSGERPSIVVTSAPSAWAAKRRHERTAAPSRRTVQAPQTPCSHARCVPVRRQLLPQELGERPPVLYFGGVGDPVDRHRDLSVRHSTPP